MGIFVQVRSHDVDKRKQKIQLYELVTMDGNDRRMLDDKSFFSDFERSLTELIKHPRIKSLAKVTYAQRI